MATKHFADTISELQHELKVILLGGEAVTQGNPFKDKYDSFFTVLRQDTVLQHHIREGGLDVQFNYKLGDCNFFLKLLFVLYERNIGADTLTNVNIYFYGKPETKFHRDRVVDSILLGFLYALLIQQGIDCHEISADIVRFILEHPEIEDDDLHILAMTVTTASSKTLDKYNQVAKLHTNFLKAQLFTRHFNNRITSKNHQMGSITTVLIDKRFGQQELKEQFLQEEATRKALLKSDS